MYPFQQIVKARCENCTHTLSYLLTRKAHQTLVKDGGGVVNGARL